MVEFINNCISYLRANPTLALILMIAGAALLIVVIVMIAVGVKRSKAKKKAKAEAEAKAEQAKKELDAKKKAEEEQKQAEEAAAARKAVEAKLEAQRLEAEKAEAEKLAAEKAEREAAEAREKAEAEAIAKADAEAEAEEAAIQKAVAEKTKQEVAKKEAKEKAEREEAEAREKAEAEAIAKADAEAEAEEAAIQKAVAEKTEKEAAEKAQKEKAAKEKTSKSATKAAISEAKVPAKTASAKSPAKEGSSSKNKRYNGKWTIYRVVTDEENEQQEEMYFFELRASNGEKLLSSEEYTSQSGAMRGIQTYKTNIEKGNFKITVSKKGDYIFKLLSGNNMLLCMGENYPILANCESAIESTKRFAKTAVIDENVQTRVIKVTSEDDGELPPLPDGYNGKWIIGSQSGVDGTPTYYFELFANNGEKLLSSEDYTTYIGAVNGIQTHKTNIEKGNFRISLTKRGDYIYKLLNGNGQLLSIGEHYKTKRLCQNAVESVRRFALNSPVLTDPNIVK